MSGLSRIQRTHSREQPVQGCDSIHGQQGVSIEGVQMPGGIAGRRRFFACSIEIWVRPTGRWRTKLDDTLSDYGAQPQLVRVEVAPGSEFEACRAILHHDAGRSGLP